MEWEMVVEGKDMGARGTYVARHYTCSAILQNRTRRQPQMHFGWRRSEIHKYIGYSTWPDHRQDILAYNETYVL